LLLEHKNILVTGGSRGLGREFCITFAREGANVAFNYASDDGSAKETASAAKAFGTSILFFKAPVTDKDAITAMVKEIESAWNSIDILVNNAAISQMLPMALLEEEDWDRLMDINVKGAYLVTRTVLRGMIRRRAGRILNIGSIAGMRPIEAPAHYAASKAALKGFTEALCKEVGRYGITVNMLSPGILQGGLSNQLPSYRLEAYLEHCALGRVGELEELSRTAAFLVSDKNSYMNGVTLMMDGGL
jgi:NAD(P)-dependent dehydrogenase (short-subunit alcohol dehydrogenase family)